MATNRQEMIEEIAEDLAAEEAYADMLAHPETVVDAFDLFDIAPAVGTVGTVATEPAFDDCNRYRYVGKCPNASEHGEPAVQPCIPPEDGD